MLKRLALEGVGWLLLLAGIAALFLPGPGLLCIFGGLALLSQQYEWAERRVEPVRLRALRGAADSVETWPRIAMSTFGVAWLVVWGIVWIWNPAAPSWWPDSGKIASLWLIGGFWTGISLVGSGILAGALVVYSYRRFHGHPEARAELDQQIDDSDGPDQ